MNKRLTKAGVSFALAFLLVLAYSGYRALSVQALGAMSRGQGIRIGESAGRPLPEAEGGMQLGDSAAQREEPEGTMPEDMPAGPKAFTNGTVTVGNVEYEHFANGEATLTSGRYATGHFVVPREITGNDGQAYLVTGIGTRTDLGLETGAFVDSAITGLSFEEGSQLRRIDNFAFTECPGLRGARIRLPDTVTYVGVEAMGLFSGTGLAELRHPHLAAVHGGLPSLEQGTPLAVPQEAKAYESVVDSSREGVVLHKSASWTNEGLTEAEIRIDYGEPNRINGRYDFVFVLDQSSSMLATATWNGDGGEAYTYPRSLLTTDIVYGAADIILSSGVEGYDNRVALTAFGTGDAPIWSRDFMGTSQEVEEALFENPLTVSHLTYYNGGLQGAIELIESRDDKSRTPVVIFLSDGEPTGGAEGADQAETLRKMGVKVYPVAIFTSPNSALRVISHDGKTAYNAADAEALQDIIMEVVEDIIQAGSTLAVRIEDVISREFRLDTGTAADIEASPGGGGVEISGDALLWDLTGCATDRVHNIRVKVRLREGLEHSASGMLPTNSSMGVPGGTQSRAQPELPRYLVRHRFENGMAPGQALPGEIMDLLPQAMGGYRTGSAVAPANPKAAVVVTPEGERWIFAGWDRGQDVVQGADVLFTGVWLQSAYRLPDTGFGGTAPFHRTGAALLGLGAVLAAIARTRRAPGKRSDNRLN